MSVNCVYCGHVNPDGSTVCLSCGRTLPPAPSAGGSYGQQPPSSYPPAGQNPSYPPAGQAPSYPPQNPYGGSYPPQQPGSFGTPPPAAQPPSYGNQPNSFGNPGYPPQQPPTPSYGQQQTPPVWSANPQPYGGGNDAAKSAKQLAMIGMIVGIVGAVLGWCCYSGFLLGPAAIVLGFLGKSKLNTAGSQDGNGMAMAAIGLGILAFIEPIVYLVIVFLIIGAGSMFGR